MHNKWTQICIDYSDSKAFPALPGNDKLFSMR